MGKRRWAACGESASWGRKPPEGLCPGSEGWPGRLRAFQFSGGSERTAKLLVLRAGRDHSDTCRRLGSQRGAVWVSPSVIPSFGTLFPLRRQEKPRSSRGTPAEFGGWRCSWAGETRGKEAHCSPRKPLWEPAPAGACAARQPDSRWAEQLSGTDQDARSLSWRGAGTFFAPLRRLRQIPSLAALLPLRGLRARLRLG